MQKQINAPFVVVLAALFAVAMAATAQAATSENVRKRGYLQCGISAGLPGFSFSDENGNWQGFHVDFCQAVAAAVLGDGAKVRYFPLTARESFTALQSGEVDLLAHDSGWTFTRDTSLGVRFVGVSYHDDQGFLVKKSLGFDSSRELAGIAICIQAGTTVEQNSAEYFLQNGLEYRPVVVDTPDQALKGFEGGRCEALAGNSYHLRGLQSRLAEPETGVFLPERLGREAVGPVVRQGDDAWFNIVRWTLYALINGEELGVTAGNVAQMRQDANLEVQRFLGIGGIKGQGLGLADDWAVQIIGQVGNYGELFERHLGQRSALKLERGRNALWSQGGLLYAPPFR